MPRDRAGSVLMPSIGISELVTCEHVLRKHPSPPSEITNDFPLVSSSVRSNSLTIVTLSIRVLAISSNWSTTSKCVLFALILPESAPELDLPILEQHVLHVWDLHHGCVLQPFIPRSLLNNQHVWQDSILGLQAAFPEHSFAKWSSRGLGLWISSSAGLGS